MERWDGMGCKMGWTMWRGGEAEWWRGGVVRATWVAWVGELLCTQPMQPTHTTPPTTLGEPQSMSAVTFQPTVTSIPWP